MESFNDKVNRLLKDSIDTHLHLNPHMAGEYHLINAYDYAKEAEKLGIRGAVIKDVSFPTTGVAYIINRALKDFKFYGSIVLNLCNGGLNILAVKLALEHGDGAKIIFFPTSDSYHHISSRKKLYNGINLDIPLSKGIKIIKSNHLLSEVLKILDLISEKNACLATGHCSPQEIYLLVDEAIKRGIKKIIINHSLWKMIGLKLEDLLYFSKKGAFIEFEYGICMPIMYFVHGEEPLNPKEVVNIIKKIGVGKCIMSTDFGQTYSPSPIDGMRYYIATMLKCGLDYKEIEIMINKNPRFLLDIK